VAVPNPTHSLLLLLFLPGHPTPQPHPKPQLKERYSKARPYGEWVKAAVTMRDVFASVPPEQREARLLAMGASTNGNGNGHVANGNGNGKAAEGGELGPIMALLAPLKANGYSREALEMLMVRLAQALGFWLGL